MYIYTYLHHFNPCRRPDLRTSCLRVRTWCVTPLYSGAGVWTGVDGADR